MTKQELIELLENWPTSYDVVRDFIGKFSDELEKLDDYDRGYDDGYTRGYFKGYKTGKENAMDKKGYRQGYCDALSEAQIKLIEMMSK